MLSYQYLYAPVWPLSAPVYPCMAPVCLYAPICSRPCRR